MPISANGQREGRRRRVLMDDRSDPESAPQKQAQRSTKSTKDSKRAYALEACREHQPVVTDFLPQRNWTLCVLTLIGLCFVAIPQALYSLTSITAGEEFQALHLTGTSTIAAWVSSMLLAGSAVLCLEIYILRRHRLDDYRARYRWWLFVGLVCLLASLNAGTHLHRIVPFAMVQWTGKELAAGGAIWSEIVLGTVVALLGIRMGIEMRHCRVALVGIVAALVGYTLHSLIQHQVWAIDSLVLAEMASAACMHLGHLSIVITLAVYARYVYRDAHGELVVPEKKKRSTSVRKTKQRTKKGASEDKSEAAEETKTETKTEDESAKFRSHRATKSNPAVQKETPEADDEDTLDFQKLSKSERRRLRKQQRRERQAA